MSPHPSLRIRSPRSAEEIARARRYHKAQGGFVLRTLLALAFLFSIQIHARAHSVILYFPFGLGATILCNVGLFIIAMKPPAPPEDEETSDLEEEP